LPRIGLLSDSHGRGRTTQKAVKLLVEQGAEMLIHLGDVGSLEVVDALVNAGEGGQPIEAHVVFGNVDWDADSLAKYATSLGVNVDHPVGRMDLDGGKTLMYLHGHDTAAFDQAILQHPTYLCHGHSHVKLDEQRNGSRIINPGALFRAREYTVALLDTDNDALAFFAVDQE